MYVVPADNEASVLSGIVQEGHALEAIRLQSGEYAIPARVRQDESLQVNGLPRYLDTLEIRTIDPDTDWDYTSITTHIGKNCWWALTDPAELPAPSTPFLWLNGMQNYQNLPDMSIYGFLDCPLVYEDQLTTGGVYDEAKAEARLDVTSIPDGYLVIDIESWDVPTLYQDYIDAIDHVRAYLNDPSIKIGFFYRPPWPNRFWDDWDLIDSTNSNDNLMALAAACDFVAPSFYMSSTWTPAMQEASMLNMLYQSRKYGLPVYPFFWGAHEPAPYPLMDTEETQKILDITTTYADGIIYWAKSDQIDWNESYGASADWWQATLPYLPSTPSNTEGVFWFLPTFS